MPDEPCLICGATPTDQHHFPRTRRYGSATIPLCRVHHTDAHWGRLTDRLLDLAPAYWRRVGEWAANIDEYEAFCSKRCYQRDTAWVR
jgi:hypothetical protein